jgi:uncharacterized membrane protein SpoIIM required for sporulation
LSRKAKPKRGWDLTGSLRRNVLLIAGVTIAFVCMIIIGAVMGSSERKIGVVESQIKETENEATEIENNFTGIELNLRLTGSILLNNVGLGVEAVGLGVAFGIFPAISLALNGMILGYYPFYLLQTGVEFSALEYFSLIIPHGLIELTALILVIVCGLKLGIASIRGLMQRQLQPLRTAGHDVLNIFPAALILFLVAGFVEGFVSVSVIGEYAKIAIGVTLFALTMAWFAGAFKRGGR